MSQEQMEAFELVDVKLDTKVTSIECMAVCGMYKVQFYLKRQLV